MTYRAPLEDVLFTMEYAAGSREGGAFGDLFAEGVARSVLEEAAKFAQQALEPLNRAGDRDGARLIEGSVITTPGWREAYATWRAGGWAGLAAPAEYGGSNLPHLLNAACMDVWNGANVSFMLAPVLSSAAIDALAAHGSASLRETYLTRLVSGEWSATMNLTEPQAGSDLSEIRAMAIPDGEGGWRLSGQKIFITYGEHDLTDNIVHLVLARTPHAPAGTRGLSLFLAPKFLIGADGSLGERNDLRCVGLEHKMGIHGAPTCTMIYGESGAGAQAWLVGEENNGLACMFTMMNNARLAVGLQGVGLCETATQRSIAFARERLQGRRPGGAGPSPIIAHPDVLRMLMTMKASTAAARAICYLTAAEIDNSLNADDEAARRAAARRASLLTPIAKAFSTDLANEVASLAVQVHGGMGYIEETGVAQLMRDARITAIYEGTNGVQAIDLVQRKASADGGETVRAEIELMRRSIDALRRLDAPQLGAAAPHLSEAIESLDRASNWIIRTAQSDARSALAGASPYLRLFALARGGVCLADLALESLRRRSRGEVDPGGDARIVCARFFAENLVPAAAGIERAIIDGAASTLAAESALEAAP